MKTLDGIVSDVVVNYATEGSLSYDFSADVPVNALVIQVGGTVIISPTSGALPIGSTFYFALSDIGGYGLIISPDTGVTLNGGTDNLSAVGAGGIVKLVYMGDDAWKLEPVCNVMRIWTNISDL
jgi:hypothetical protein